MNIDFLSDLGKRVIASDNISGEFTQDEILLVQQEISDEIDSWEDREMEEDDDIIDLYNILTIHIRENKL